MAAADFGRFVCAERIAGVHELLGATRSELVGMRQEDRRRFGTVEIDEVEDLNDKLAGLDELRHITAYELGLAEAAAQGVDGPTALPAAAKLTRLCCEGPQGFPYVHGHFDMAGVELKVDLHSVTLTALGKRLHVPIAADLGD